MHPTKLHVLEEYLAIMSLAGVFLLASASAATWAPNAQSSSQESSQSSAQTAGEKAAEAQRPEKDANHFLLTGIAVHEDGSGWEGLEVVLFPRNKKSGKSQVGYGLNPDTGHVELGNPNARSDAKGRFAIKVHRGYLEKDAEETEFRIGYLESVRGTVGLVEMRKKGSKEPLILKVKQDVATVDLGEVW